MIRPQTIHIEFNEEGGAGVTAIFKVNKAEEDRFARVESAQSMNDDPLLSEAVGQLVVLLSGDTLGILRGAVADAAV